MDTCISRKISIARYLMIAGIVILHVPPYMTISELNGTFFLNVKAFFSLALFRFTVPVLTAISGYLLFQNFKIYKYKNIIYNKTFSLLLPLFLWNFPLVVILFFIQFYKLIDYDFSFKSYPFDLISWLNGTFGLIDKPVNYPLNFLRDLFILMLLAPIFYFLLKNFKWVGFIFISIFFLKNWDGYLILRETMPINFCTGAMAALYKWDVKKLDGYAKPIFIILILACIAIVYFGIVNRTYFIITSPFLIWPALSLLEKNRLGDFFVRQSPNSFFIFLSHGPILLITWLLYKKLLHLYINYEIYWLLSPIIVIACCTLLYRLGKKYFSKFTVVLAGGR